MNKVTVFTPTFCWLRTLSHHTKISVLSQSILGSLRDSQTSPHSWAQLLPGLSWACTVCAVTVLQENAPLFRSPQTVGLSCCNSALLPTLKILAAFPIGASPLCCSRDQLPLPSLTGLSSAISSLRTDLQDLCRKPSPHNPTFQNVSPSIPASDAWVVSNPFFFDKITLCWILISQFYRSTWFPILPVSSHKGITTPIL